MSLSRCNVERCLHLLWEYSSQTDVPEQLQAYEQAISGLHAYLTDVLPATLPCVRAKAQHGVMEIFRDEGARAQEIELYLEDGDKLGIVLDSIDVNGAGNTASPIAIALIRPNSAAAKDNRLARGDQVLCINNYSLSKVSLQRARWLLDSAERSNIVTLSIISSGLRDSLKHSISRQNLNALTPYNRRHESTDRRRVQRLLGHRNQPSPKEIEKASSRSSMHVKPGYVPSIGSRHNSDYSLVSSTVETAAHLARSSMHSSKAGASFEMPFKQRKVRKMHIMKGASGLGLRIIGGKGFKYGDMGIFVRQLEEGGAAFNDGRLHPGDELLMVDGKSLVGLTHDEAVAILKATQKLVQLVVATEHIEGESINSSLQSIPEVIASMIAGMKDRQLEGEQQIHHSNAAIVASELLKSPPKDAFQMDDFEMETRTDNSFQQPTGKLETTFQGVNNKTEIIEIARSEGQPLGFSIQGNMSAIFVHAIDPDGPAGRSKLLHEGDQVLKANGVSLENSAQQDALAVLKSLRGEVITLEIISRTVTKEILIQKIPGKPLGIKLTSQATTQSALPVVIIENIALGSPAHASGTLSPGSQLVSVNGMKVGAMSVEQIRGLLASIPGGDIKLVVLESQTMTRMDSGSDDIDQSNNDTNLMRTQPPEIPHFPPLLGDISENSSSKERDIDEESITDHRHSGVIQISQSKRSRPESTFIEISGSPDHTFSTSPAPSPLGSLQTDQTTPPLSSLPSQTDLTTPPLSSLPPSQTDLTTPPLSSLPSQTDLATPPLNSQTDLTTPPVGFLSMQFQLTKRARGGIGITLVASEGPTAGLFMVRRIASNGIAAKDGRIQVGDRLVSVNGVSFFEMSHAAILQTLTDANKKLELVVWRDPNHTLRSSSMHSFSSYQSGSHSSLVSEEDSSPPLGGKKPQLSRGFLPRDSPLASGSRESSQQRKRWSDGDILTHQIPKEPDHPIHPDLPEIAIPPDLPKTMVPPGLPETMVPPDLPETMVPPDLPETMVPPDLPETMVPPDLLETMVPPGLPETIVPPDLPPSPDLPETMVPPGLPETMVPQDLPPPPDLPETMVPPGLPETMVPQDLPPPPDLPETMVPPGLPETMVPPDLPETMVPPDLPETMVPPDLPETMVPPDLPETMVPPDGSLPVLPESAPPDFPSTLPPEITSEFLPEVTSTLPEIPSNISPPESPKAQPFQPPPPSPPDPSPVPPSEVEDPATPVLKVVDNRPPSLQVPRGARLEKSPFEIELRKGLFNIGASLVVNSMGMLVIKSLTSRSIIAQDGNIRVGDILLSINDESTIGLSSEEAESYLKSLPRGPFRLTVTAPFKDVTQERSKQECPPASPEPLKEITPSPLKPEPLKESTVADGDESIVKAILQCNAGCSLGFEIEGGSDTPLQYVYIKSLVYDTPAFNCQKFSEGDQIIMAGDSCFIGLTHSEATNILKNVPAIVEVVAQRKVTVPLEPSSTTPDLIPSGSQQEDKRPQASDFDTPIREGQKTSSCENVRSSGNPVEQKTSLIQEKVVLNRTLGEKLGITIVGGTDNPKLKQIHVKQVLPDGVASHDGRIKKGDRIISVNGCDVAGLTNKEALLKLKEAGDRVILITTRKIRRSTQHSRQASSANSHAVSRMSPEHSPKLTRRKGYGTGSSDEGSREGSCTASPRHSRKHQRRLSVTTHGEVLTFRDQKSTLPREIKGDKSGVHLVELHKGPTGLGLQLQGSSDPKTPITVKAVLKGGPASRSGKIHERDEVIEVNGTSFENMSYQEALKVMKSLPQGKISIILRNHDPMGD